MLGSDWLLRTILLAVLLLVVPCLAWAGPCPQTIGLANNNPGNISSVRVRWWKAVGRDRWGHLKFRHRIDGLRALRRNLSLYWTVHHIHTIDGISHRWLTYHKEKEIREYERALAYLTRLAPNAPLDMTDPVVLEVQARAIVYIENGCNPYPDSLWRSAFHTSPEETP